MIREAYVSFEVAKLLNEKGFVQETLMVYNQNGNFMPNGAIEDTYQVFYSAPTHQMAMAWLREVHNLHIDIDPSEGNWNPTVITLNDWTCVIRFGETIPIQDTYEEAVEAALKYTLENVIYHN